jgi:pimeloyl-ACP methyl ester carboxylesterase
MIRSTLFTIAACCAVVSSARAQATPVLLIHGIETDASTWASTKAALNATGNYDAHAISLTWTDHLSSQASAVSSYLSGTGVADSTILVGHSQGGLVARIATRTTAVGGILTIGTPHDGAPIVNSSSELILDEAEIGLDEYLAVTGLPTYCDNHPGEDACEVSPSAVYLAADGLGLLELGGGVAGEWTLSHDDIPEMNPGSTTIAGLQSGYASEQSGGRRVSIRVDDEQEEAGPFRFLYGADLGSNYSTEAEDAASDMATIGYLFELWGLNAETVIDPDEAGALDEEDMAGAMDDMGFFLQQFCAIDWNYDFVGGGANDGIVPWLNQVMPSSSTVSLLYRSHAEETNQSSAILGALNSMTGR